MSNFFGILGADKSPDVPVEGRVVCGLLGIDGVVTSCWAGKAVVTGAVIKDVGAIFGC